MRSGSHKVKGSFPRLPPVVSLQVFLMGTCCLFKGGDRKPCVGRFLRKALSLLSKDSGGASGCHHYRLINIGSRPQPLKNKKEERSLSVRRDCKREIGDSRTSRAGKLALIALATPALKCLTHGKHHSSSKWCFKGE